MKRGRAQVCFLRDAGPPRGQQRGMAVGVGAGHYPGTPGSRKASKVSVHQMQGSEYWGQRTYQVPKDQAPRNMDHKTPDQTARRSHSWRAASYPGSWTASWKRPGQQQEAESGVHIQSDQATGHLWSEISWCTVTGPRTKEGPPSVDGPAPSHYLQSPVQDGNGAGH